jgi:sphingosine kinase
LAKIDLAIKYASPLGKNDVRVASITYPLDPSSTATIEAAQTWVTRLLDRSYGKSKKEKRIKVLINPFGGAGRAAKSYSGEIEPIFTAACCQVDVERTTYRGHAVEIAEMIDSSAYDVIASCSGDGLPHEVFNGLAKKPNARQALREVAVVQLPCGTGNAMSWNLNGTGSCSMAALAIVKGLRTPLDLVSVTQGEKRILSFLSQAIGIVAETDLGTDNIRWMGSARFTYGFFVRLLGKTVYPCDLAIKTEIADKPSIKAHYLVNRTKGYKTSMRDSDAVTVSSRHYGNANGNANGNGDDNANGSTDLTNNTIPCADQTGLPPLEHGTVQDALPSDWTLTPYPTLGNFYSGNMAIMAKSTPIFPASLPADGLLDLVTIDGNISRAKSISTLLAVENGNFFDMQHVNVRKVSAFRVVPKFGKWSTRSPSSPSTTSKPQQQTQSPSESHILGHASTATGGSSSSPGPNQPPDGDGGYIAIDGEKIPFEPFQVEVHRGLGTVLSRSGYLYETHGPAG